jgi:hypothetical protein
MNNMKEVPTDMIPPQNGNKWGPDYKSIISPEGEVLYDNLSFRTNDLDLFIKQIGFIRGKSAKQKHVELFNKIKSYFLSFFK